MAFEVVRKKKSLRAENVLFAKLNFTTHCKSAICANPRNTRIFASDLPFAEFRAILRGVVVKKIHNLPVVMRKADCNNFRATYNGYSSKA